MTTTDNLISKKGTKKEVIKEKDMKGFFEYQSKRYIDNELAKLFRDTTEKFVEETELKLKDIEIKFEEKIEKKETKTTEILAVFITLFTFISINISIFTRVQDILTAATLMLLITFLCTFLLCLSFFMLSDQTKEKRYLSGLFSLIALFLLLGIVTLVKFGFLKNIALNPAPKEQTVKSIKAEFN